MKLKYKFRFQQYDNKYMAIAEYNTDEENLRLIWVNDTGKKIMEFLQEETSFEELLARLRLKYQESDDLEYSVSNFINELKTSGFLDN